MKDMKQVRVYVQDGGVIIEQQVSPFDNADMIDLTPEQVPLVIKWLREAVAEAKAKQ